MTDELPPAAPTPPDGGSLTGLLSLSISHAMSVASVEGLYKKLVEMYGDEAYVTRAADNAASVIEVYQRSSSQQGVRPPRRLG